MGIQSARVKFMRNPAYAEVLNNVLKTEIKMGKRGGKEIPKGEVV